MPKTTIFSTKVERAFRTIKTGDLEVRPVFHWATPRVKAHVLVCASDCSGFGRMEGGWRRVLQERRGMCGAILN